MVLLAGTAGLVGGFVFGSRWLEQADDDRCRTLDEAYDLGMLPGRTTPVTIPAGRPLYVSTVHPGRVEIREFLSVAGEYGRCPQGERPTLLHLEGTE